MGILKNLWEWLNPFLGEDLGEDIGEDLGEDICEDLEELSLNFDEGVNLQDGGKLYGLSESYSYHTYCTFYQNLF